VTPGLESVQVAEKKQRGERHRKIISVTTFCEIRGGVHHPRRKGERGMGGAGSLKRGDTKARAKRSGASEERVRRSERVYIQDREKREV